MCLQADGIDKNDGGVGRVRRAKGLRNDDIVVGRGQGIRNASEGTEKMTEAAGDIRRPRGIYNNNRGVVGEDEQKDYNNENGCVGEG